MVEKMHKDKSVWMSYFICRLLNSFAEEQALEDAIYYLGEALRKNVITSDVFLKVKLEFHICKHICSLVMK